MSAEGPALALRGITKRFGTTPALEGASLLVRRGSLHMLLGENGAGKTTLLHIAAGNIQPDAGMIALNGRDVRWRSRGDALAAGLSAVYQHFSLVPAMTVAENVALSQRHLCTTFTMAAAATSVRRVAQAVGLSVDPAAIVGDLSVAAQQRVEIIKAIAHDAPMLMLDEPTAVLSPSESADLFQWLRTFVSRGRTVVVVTHRIREAMEHGDALTVLRGGHTVLSADMVGLAEEVVLGAILGESPDRLPGIRATGRPPAGPRGQHQTQVLSLHNATVSDKRGVVKLAPTSLAIHRGELIGIAGVDGSGHHELLRVLAGRLIPTNGTVSTPSNLGFIPEDRLRDAVIPEFTLGENMALRGAGDRRGVISWPSILSATAALMQLFDVRGATVGANVANLSGGNQQKFVLARELADTPTALVAENPTRGLDVRASRDILERLRDARNAGAAVVAYSSDVDELLSISDRVFVCYGGGVREVSCNAEAIGRAMIGAT